MFIRTKTIKGKNYLYMVCSYREGSKVKQIQKYLGRAGEVEVDQQGLRDNLWDKVWGVSCRVSDEKRWAEEREMKKIDRLGLEEALKLATHLKDSMGKIINRGKRYNDVKKQKVTFAEPFELLSLSVDIAQLIPKTAGLVYDEEIIDALSLFREEIYKLSGEIAKREKIFWS